MLVTIRVRKLISIHFGILEFQKLWRSVPVDSMDEEKIEDYLKRQGISSMQDVGPKKLVSNFLLVFCFFRINIFNL